MYISCETRITIGNSPKPTIPHSPQLRNSNLTLTITKKHLHQDEVYR